MHTAIVALCVITAAFWGLYFLRKPIVFALGVSTYPGLIFAAYLLLTGRIGYALLAAAAAVIAPMVAMVLAFAIDAADGAHQKAD